tara:strand:- start:277 stop:573 length:297 start_codon:yes stop_codon:yes gene_type:complete
MTNESGDKAPQSKPIFESHITLRNWALELVEACGGRKYVAVGKQLNRSNTKKIAVLLDAFAEQHNFIQAHIEKEKENAKTEIPNKDIEGTQTEKTEEE